jgi:hypothetical protein
LETLAMTWGGLIGANRTLFVPAVGGGSGGAGGRANWADAWTTTQKPVAQVNKQGKFFPQIIVFIDQRANVA